MKEVITQVSIVRDGGNPVFDCIQVRPMDEAAGSHLEIQGYDEANHGSKLSFDWDEWDAIVATVAKHREQWEWE